MSTHRLTLILAAAVLLTTMGGAGVTVFYAGADGTKPAATPEKEKDKPPRAEAPPAERDRPKTEASNETVQGMLRQPLAADKDLPPTLSLKEFLEFLRDRFNVPIRIDLAAFARMGYPEAVQLYDSQVKLPVVRGMTLADGLRDVLAQLSANGGGEGGGAASHGATFRIRNGQILIIPAYRLSGRSVGGPPPNGEDEVIVPANVLLEQLEGEPISLSVDEKPFAEVLRELRQTTGANIVLDAREKDKAKLAVSATLNDVRLMAALRVLGDMCDLQPVSLNNVFYVTSKENAEKLQREIDRRRYGDPQPSLGGLGGAPANPPPMSTPPSKPKSP